MKSSLRLYVAIAGVAFIALARFTGAVGLAGEPVTKTVGAKTASAEAPAATSAPQDENVVLPPDAVANLGIQVTTAKPAQFTSRADGFGQVMPVDSWAQAEADLATYETARETSQMALQRAQSLFQADISISRQALETAQRQNATDTAQLALAERKAATVFGLRPPWRSAAERSAVLQRLTAGSEVLIRITLAPGYAGAAPKQLTVRRPLRDESTQWSATAIWDAPADPTLPGRSFFALVQGSDLAPGERVIAAAPRGESVSGVLVPADSVVISEGQAWCFVAVKPGTFARRPVDLSRPMPGGYFVTQGVQAGSSVVTAGSALLLARQMNPATEPEDE